MLTLQQLREMPPHTIFASGEITNSPEGIYMSNYRAGEMLHRVAKRGYIADWAVYVYRKNEGWSTIDVARKGSKVITKKYIQRVVPCDDDTFSAYRF